MAFEHEKVASYVATEDRKLTSYVTIEGRKFQSSNEIGRGVIQAMTDMSASICSLA